MTRFCERCGNARTEPQCLTLLGDDIIMSLSPEQAQALRSVLANVGGDPLRSPRGHIDDVYNALTVAMHEKGIEFVGYPFVSHSNSLYFKDGLALSGLRIEADGSLKPAGGKTP